MRTPRPQIYLTLTAGAITLLLFRLHLSPPVCVVPESPSGTPEVQTWPMPPARPSPTPCQANESMASLPEFLGQPQHVRNFLLYRHCRDFQLLQDAPLEKCAGPVFLLLVIKSSPGNYERRELVRRTWGLERRVLGLQLRRLFLVGTAPSPHEASKVNRLLALESQRHGDILQWDFHDTFFNLTLKQVLFLQWQETRCSNANFVLNGDDDVFAHTDNMVSYLQNHDPSRHLFVGHLIQNVGPIRVPWSKYYVPKVVTQEEHYPPYCGGGGFLLSRFTTDAIRPVVGGFIEAVKEVFPLLTCDVIRSNAVTTNRIETAVHGRHRTSDSGISPGLVSLRIQEIQEGYWGWRGLHQV
ncbi:N-acetyllactosaminide beta-1,3-N-acetylglucosaminyltransferase 3 [Tupaia chinensis]|uniref:N-acetyllactosaminide beta-1,3-N-acetylglucosaminyltransferase 3 n=1 Tax=Tupaia chinensis TaxID=246437 RepID=UPI0003C8DBB4|nr:N-acetyllactosaminide beta-1,3-N-acetylglucosaminyltransferase 3 [Tupaia chinensis]